MLGRLSYVRVNYFLWIESLLHFLTLLDKCYLSLRLNSKSYKSSLKMSKWIIRFHFLCKISVAAMMFRGVLVFLKFSHFSPERKETGSLSATESEFWIGDFNVKAWKLPSTNSTKSGAHYNFAKIQENKHTPEYKSELSVHYW